MRMRILIVVSLICTASAAQAQWWPLFAPQDYEDCVARAEKTDTSKETRAAMVTECDGKFSGRRKPGGGYSYYDFMQDRHFDIAGPNPTPEELKMIDQEYTGYLERQRHAAIAAALLQKQHQQAEGATASPLAHPATTGAIIAAKPPIMPRHVAAARPARPKGPPCQSRLSCTWTDLSASVRGLFDPPVKPRPPAKI